MAKVRGPLLSLTAQGQIGQSQVYGTWRGVPYARRYVIPGNPNTTAQQTTRSTFSAADDQFKRMLTLAQAPWHAQARGRSYTGRNAFIRDYVRQLRGQPDFAQYIGSPGAQGGLPLLALTAVGGALAGEIDITADVPPTPVGWTHDAVIITAFPDRDPSALMSVFAQETEVLEAAWTVGPPPQASYTFSGLQTGVTYVISAWLRSTRADGTTAYGVSTTSLTAAT